jgi:hypothetical protein
MQGSQSFSTTINRLSNVLSTILEEHNGTTAPGIRPKSFDSTQRSLKNRDPFRNTASFTNEVQASTYNSKNHGSAALQQKSKRGKLQENLHHSNSQADSIIPMRKESHSSKCTILAVRLDTLSSSMDICFIKPQDLLALSIAICAWRLDKVKRLSRSAILEEYSSHRQTGRGGDETPESKASAENGA